MAPLLYEPFGAAIGFAAGGGGGSSMTGAGRSGAGSPLSGMCGTASSVDTSRRGRVGVSGGVVGLPSDRNRSAPSPPDDRGATAATKVGGNGKGAATAFSIPPAAAPPSWADDRIGDVIGCGESDSIRFVGLLFAERPATAAPCSLALAGGGRATASGLTAGSGASRESCGGSIDNGWAVSLVLGGGAGSGAGCIGSAGVGGTTTEAAATAAGPGLGAANDANSDGSKGKAALGSVAIESGVRSSGGLGAAGSGAAGSGTGVVADEAPVLAGCGCPVTAPATAAESAPSTAWPTG